MSNCTRYLGLNVHAETLTAAIAEERGKIRSLGKFPNRGRCRCFAATMTNSRQPRAAPVLFYRQRSAARASSIPQMVREAEGLCDCLSMEARAIGLAKGETGPAE
jgi:hypothetical protein